MHGGANALYSAMHGGGVQPPRDVHGDEAADVYPVMDHGGLGYPAMDHGGVRTSCIHRGGRELALFSSKNFGKIDTIALSFVFDKYCPIMN